MKNVYFCPFTQKDCVENCALYMGSREDEIDKQDDWGCAFYNISDDLQIIRMMADDGGININADIDFGGTDLTITQQKKRKYY